MQPTSTKSDLNVPLKLAILASGRRQHEIARRARIREVRLSTIVNGHIEPTDAEKRRIAKVLRLAQSDLFPTTEATA